MTYIKSLSIKQPWAWLIVSGYKDVENRTWKTEFRGPLLIHAGKKFDADGYRWVKNHFPGIPLPAPGGFLKGGIVGIADLAGLVGEKSPFKASPWFTGPEGFIIHNAAPLTFQPMKGKLSLFEVDREALALTPEDLEILKRITGKE